MPIGVPFHFFLDFSKASNSFRVTYIPLGLCWSCWDLGLFPSDLLQCTCYHCLLPCPAQKGGGGKFSPSALSLCRYESKSFRRCPFLSPVGNPTSPGSLLLSLLPDQSTESPALRDPRMQKGGRLSVSQSARTQCSNPRYKYLYGGWFIGYLEVLIQL